MCNKMSSVISFIFNAVDLYIVTINGKPWTRAKEVCKALKYQRQTAHVIRDYVSAEKFTYKYQLIKLAETDTFANWPKDSRKDDYYINEEEMYELLFPSQQPKAKSFRKYCCNVMFPHIRQQLTDEMVDDLRRDHQLAIQAIQHENVTLQLQRDVYQTQLKRCLDQIHDFIINRHVPRANDPGKDNIVMIFEKNTTPEKDEFYEYPYYIARIQRRFINTKRGWLRAQYPHHRFIVEELDNANSIHAFEASI